MDEKRKSLSRSKRPERRQESNADLRARLNEIGKKVSDHPKLTEDDMSQLYELMRNYYRRGLVSRSFDMLQIVRDAHADEFSPAMQALLDNVLDRPAEMDESSKSLPSSDRPERRQESNVELRVELDEIGEKVTHSPKLTKDDMSQLFELLRDYYRRGLGSRSRDLLRLVREEHADELRPAMVALLDKALGRDCRK